MPKSCVTDYSNELFISYIKTFNFEIKSKLVKLVLFTLLLEGNMKKIIACLLFHLSMLVNLESAVVSQEIFQSFLKEYYSSVEKNQKDYSKLLYAVDKNYNEIAFTLLEKGEVPHFISKTNPSPFLLAIFKEDRDMVKKMIQCGANVNLQEQIGDKIGHQINYGWASQLTPLQLATISNIKSDILRLLCENGSEVIDNANFYVTSFGISIRNGDWEKFQILIEHFHGNICQIFNTYSSFLTICGSNFPHSESQMIGAAKIGQYLIDCGVPMQTKNSSALSTAASCGNIDFMKILIQNGANINFTPVTGHFTSVPIFSALDYYRTIQNVKKIEKFKNLESFFFKETLELLLDNGAKMDFSSVNHVHHISPLGYALEHCVNESIEILIQYGANPNYIDSEGKSALIRGIEVNNIEGVKLLLSLGANPLEKGRGSLYPIDVAFKKGNLEIVDLLIEAEGLWYTNKE